MRHDGTDPIPSDESPRTVLGRVVAEAWSPGSGTSVFLLLAVVMTAIYLPGLGFAELKGEEERRILPAIEMMRTGNWTQPMLGGEPYHTKPPMINWIIAGSFLATGVVNEWTARIPSLLGMLLFVAVLAWYPSRHLSNRARLVAGLVFLTNIGMFEKGRLIEMEALLVGITGAACLWWFLARWNGEGPWRQWTVPALLLAVGLLLKGPPIVLFLYGFVGCVLLAERRVRDLFSPAHLVCAAFALGCFALWFSMSAKQTSTSDVSFRLGHEAIARFLVGSNLAEWARISLMSFVNFLPWVFFVPLLWSRSLLEGLDERGRTLFVGARWGIVLTFLPLALLPGTSARYTMPVFPMTSILLGLAFVRMPPGTFESAFGRVGLLVGVLGCVAAQLVGWWVVAPTVAGLLVVLATVAIAAWTWNQRDALHGRFARVWGVAGITVAAGIGYAVFVTPLLAQRERFRPAGAAVSEHVPEGERVHVYQPGPQEFLFYVERPVGYVLAPGEVDDDVHYLVVREQHVAEVESSESVAGRTVTEVHRFNERLPGNFRLLRFTGPRVAARDDG